jgi:hypothetical protein
MKHLLIFLLFSASVNNQESPRAFRQTTWGMSKAQVKSVETAKLISNSPTSLQYAVTVDGDSFVADYSFKDDKLIQCTLLYNEKHSSKELYMDKFNEIASTLDKKYGEHTDYTKWLETLYKDSPESWGLACSAGHVTFRYRWMEKSGSNIGIIMTGDNYKITLGILYFDAKHIDEEKTEF